MKCTQEEYMYMSTFGTKVVFNHMYLSTAQLCMDVHILYFLLPFHARLYQRNFIAQLRTQFCEKHTACTRTHNKVIPRVTSPLRKSINIVIPEYMYTITWNMQFSHFRRCSIFPTRQNGNDTQPTTHITTQYYMHLLFSWTTW